LVRYIVDPDADPDVELLVEAIATLRDLHRFWIDIEIDSGGFFGVDGSQVEDVDPDEVVPLSLVMLQHCLDAYLEALAESPDLGASD
jgi:hypothetical protein